MIQQFSRLYFVEILGFSVMDTHFHIVARMLPEKDFSDKDIIDRYESFWGDLSEFSEDWIPGLRKKWANLSGFMKDIKQAFSRFYNKRHDHKGTFWTERFKSIIVEQ